MGSPIRLDRDGLVAVYYVPTRPTQRDGTAEHQGAGRFVCDASEGKAMMDREAIRKMLVEILEEDTGNSFTDLTENDSLREGLGLDSVDVVSVVSQIERRMKIRLSQEDLEKLVTVGDILDLLVAKMASSPKSAAA